VLALLSLARSPARLRGELAHDEADDQVDRKREPVLRLGQPEGVNRRQEEEVEGEHARNRDENRVCATPEDRHRQHREEIEHAEAQHRHRVAQKVDGGGDHAYRRNAARDGNRSSSGN
jgi:hypothetical protein